MKAFRFGDILTGLELRDIPVPRPGYGQSLISVKAAGLCHSDAHIVKGQGDSWVQRRPITLGHEVSGTIVELGAGPSPFNIGDRVAVGLQAQPVASANWAEAIGLGYDGGYAEFAIAHYKHLVKIPENVTFAQAAVATDSILTAYHAVTVSAGVTKSSVVGIIGLGGLGLNGVIISALQGAEVYGVDVNTAQFDEAKRCGATKCATSLDDFSGVSFDVIIDFTGVGTTTAAAVSAVKISGTVVLVGLGASTVPIPSSPFVTRDVTLRASLGGSVEDLETILGLIASGAISPKVEEIPFEDIPKGLERLEKNQVKGRLFACPAFS
ncbi:alcohol dehydrogenase [Neofusicoccum parvum]|nr:alcohol dehydrogenase [Neofusicoccum parvum]